jgi:hypothetical protein
METFLFAGTVQHIRRFSKHLVFIDLINVTPITHNASSPPSSSVPAPAEDFSVIEVGVFLVFFFVGGKRAFEI